MGSTVFTQTFTFEDETVTVKGSLTGVSSIQNTLQAAQTYANLLKQAVNLIQAIAHDADIEQEPFKKATVFLNELQEIALINTQPTLTFSDDEAYNRVILDLQQGIEKQKALLRQYEDDYAKQKSPYKEGEFYNTPKGMFYIHSVTSSHTNACGYTIRGIKYKTKDVPFTDHRKNTVTLYPNTTWKKA